MTGPRRIVVRKTVAIALLLCTFGAVGFARTSAIIIDRNGVDLSAIPPDSVAAAASLRVLLRHASVGQGIGWGLDCLAGLKSNQSACKCYAAGTYDRSKWVLEARMGDGRTKIDDLVTQAETRADQFDVFMMKYCYIDALGNSHPDWEYYRGKMEQLEAQYPQKRFIWWTIPLTRDGQPGTDVFNALVRAYCTANAKILFDIADIECHEPSGVKLTNARGNEVISATYTNEIHAGHLNIEGRIRVASALWRLMAAVAADMGEPAGPRVIYVDDDAVVGTGNGSSWQTAYRHLQDALATARTMAKPVEIRVAQGIYRPDRGVNQVAGDREATFALIDAVTLRGGYAGVSAADPGLRDPRGYETVLSGDLLGDDGVPDHSHHPAWHRTRSDNCEHVVTGVQVTAATVLDGLTVSGGNNLTIFHHDEGPSAGGPGVYLSRASPALVHCRFHGNNTISGDGGGLFIYDGSEPFVSGCVFSDNSATEGGAICTRYMSNATILNCLFYNNCADDGGALCSRSSGPHISNCVFSGNRARGGGGALSFWFQNSATIVNCTFHGNHAEYEGGVVWGLPDARPSTNRIVNCILWGNTPDEIVFSALGVLVSHCSIAGGWPGTGNIDADPLFANPGRWAHVEDLTNDAEPNDPNAVWVDGDYHLKSQAGRWDPEGQRWIYDNVTSPCIDAGDPNTDWAAELWPHGGRANIGAYGGTPQASMSLSVVGSPADLSHDGIADARDLLLLAADWLVGPAPLVADLDRDGLVNLRDFVRLAGKWRIDPGEVHGPIEIALGRRAKWSSRHAGYDPNLPGYHIVGDIASATLRAQTDDLPDRLVLAIQTSPGMIAMLEGFTFAAPCVMVDGEPFGEAGLTVSMRADTTKPWQVDADVQPGAYFTFDRVGDEVRTTFLPPAIELLKTPCKLSWIDWYR